MRTSGRTSLLAKPNLHRAGPGGRKTYIKRWAKGLPLNPHRVLALFFFLSLSLSLPIQELNQGLLHCRWILYQLSYQGSPKHYAKWNKPDRKGQILYDSIYIKYLEEANSYRNKVSQRLPGSQEEETNKLFNGCLSFPICKERELKKVLLRSLPVQTRYDPLSYKRWPQTQHFYTVSQGMKEAFLTSKHITVN